MAARIASASCPNLLENEGALPRDEEGVVNIPALQNHGAHSEPMTEQHRAPAPQKAFLSPPSASDNIYALFARATPAISPQPYLDFHDLLLFSGRAEAKAGLRVGGVIVDAEKAFYAYTCNLAVSFQNSLRATGRHAMSLFEVVIVIQAWFKAAGENTGVGGGGREVGREVVTEHMLSLIHI